MVYNVSVKQKDGFIYTTFSWEPLNNPRWLRVLAFGTLDRIYLTFSNSREAFFTRRHPRCLPTWELSLLVIWDATCVQSVKCTQLLYAYTNHRRSCDGVRRLHILLYLPRVHLICEGQFSEEMSTTSQAGADLWMDKEVLRYTHRLVPLPSSHARPSFLGLHLMIIIFFYLSLDCFLNYPISCLVCKISENAEQWPSQMTGFAHNPMIFS